MGTPIRILNEVTHTIESLSTSWSGGKVGQLSDRPTAVMLCPGDNPNWDECPAVFGFMASRSLDLRIADGRATMLFPQSESDMVLVLAPGTGAALDALSDETQSLPVSPTPEHDIPLRENVDRYRVYRNFRQEPAAESEPIASSRLANGVELLGPALDAAPRPGQTTRLSLNWRIAKLPPDPPLQGYSFANHLLDADGQRLGQADGPGYPVELWRQGDRLVSWFDLAVPAGAPPAPYLLRTGMYVFVPPDQFITVPLIDAQGVPVADAAEYVLP
jgi:hypothetical protein